MQTAIALAALAATAISIGGCSSDLPFAPSDRHHATALGTDAAVTLQQVDPVSLEGCGSTPPGTGCVTVWRIALTPAAYPDPSYFDGGAAVLIWNRAKSTLCWSITLAVADPSILSAVQVRGFILDPLDGTAVELVVGVPSQTGAANTGCVDVTGFESFLTPFAQDPTAYQLVVITTHGELSGGVN